MTPRQRVFALLIVVLGCTALALTYVMRAAKTAPRAEAVLSSDPTALAAVLEEPHVLFRSTRPGSGYGKLAAAPLNEPSEVRYETPLSCDRVDFAARTGVCLTANRGMRTTYSAVVFDDRFRVLHTIPLAGIPSRVRLSPNGRLAGVTTFVSGHSYADGTFSTQTLIVDTARGKPLIDLEALDVTRDGRPFKQQDFNFWGVTFTRDSNAFYATLSSGGVIYLIQADASSSVARVIARDIECPSLSPDNAFIAFKKRQVAAGRLTWRLALLELKTGDQRIIDGETASVDDQVAWLDDRQILYATPHPSQAGSMVVSAISIDGGPPRRFLSDAYSPAVAGN